MKKFTIILTIILTLSLSIIGCSSTSDDSISVSDNSSGNKEVAIIYTSDDQAEGLVDKEITLKSLTADSLFNELKALNVIPKDTKLNNFDKYVEDSESIGVINFSKEFYNFNLGSSGEILMLDSIAKTYIENFKLDKFKILVDGEEYQSGHILYEKDDYFTLDSIS